MWLALAEIGLLVGDYVYHRWINPPPVPVNPAQTFTIPTAQAGNPIPQVYGCAKVDAPVLAWCGQPGSVEYGVTPAYFADIWGTPTQGEVFMLNMFFNVATGFANPAPPIRPDVTMIGIWMGGAFLGAANEGSFGGEGGGYIDGHRTPWVLSVIPPSGFTSAPFIPGLMEFCDGGEDQLLVDPSGPTSRSSTADSMNAVGDTRVGLANIPGYRGYLSAMLYGFPGLSFGLGSSAQPPQFSFVAASYPASPLARSQIVNADLLGQPGATSNHSLFADGHSNPAYAWDANPADVILDLLTSPRGGLGLDSSWLDMASFRAMAETLDEEGHGFSRCWTDAGMTTADKINEVLKQVDGSLRFDPSTQMISVKLVRPDYDPTQLLEIDPSNCSELSQFNASGWVGLPNKITVTFTDRRNQWQQGTAIDSDQANASLYDPEVLNTTLAMPGITNQTLADAVAHRERMARCRPLLKCHATVSRDFLRCNVGDALLLTWPEAGMSRIPVRIANVDRGTLAKGEIGLDLIQDYFWQYKNNAPVQL